MPQGVRLTVNIDQLQTTDLTPIGHVYALTCFLQTAELPV